ncbi:aldose 1-epimerase family protein [Caproiciproducens sp. R2]|uniref:aldose 1-epimerase family protein n=1 Tax=Caproiciproducens sp. R2 TaxID=3435187 RepID=UPI004034F668
MKKEDILRRVGNVQQIAYARRVTYDEGRSTGMRAVEVKNGPLRFVTMLDKALDICEMEYKGLQINFLSKPGLMGRNPYDTHGAEAQRSIMGGLFFTCGFENICAPYTGPDGREYPMHGRMRTTPAEHVCADSAWDGDDYVVTVRGEMREAELFGENLVLRRTITTRLGESSIRVADEITNEAFRPEPVMLMYHCNMGWPFLSENSRLLLPTKKVTPRDGVSAACADTWDIMGPPKDNKPENVFLHELASAGDGETFAAVVNDERKLALVLEFNTEQFPFFMQWKSEGSGDYVLGLEPSNSSVYGRSYHEKAGTLHFLAPQTVEKKQLTFRIAEGKQAIEALENRRGSLLGL